jgi:KaiC/GvpD/RAD55 family RecA-like ATPase
MDRVSTGVAGLDKMLRGGLIPRRPYVISGASGTGKTILAMQFIVEGLKQGEACMWVSLDEPPNELKANMTAFGWNLDHLKILDATPDIRMHKRKSVIDVGTTLDVRDMEEVKGIRVSQQLRSMEVSIHSVQKMLKQEFFQHQERTGENYQRIAIDSLTALKMFSLVGVDSRIMIQSFMRFLSELEATCLIISEHLDTSIIETEFFLARGKIRLHKWLDGSSIRRAISIEKMRGTGFDEKMRQLTIGPNGVTVDPSSRVPLNTTVVHALGSQFLEKRIAEQATVSIEKAFEMAEQCRHQGHDISRVEMDLTRAMLMVQRGQLHDAMEMVERVRLGMELLLKPKSEAPPPPPPPEEARGI